MRLVTLIAIFLFVYVMVINSTNLIEFSTAQVVALTGIILVSYIFFWNLRQEKKQELERQETYDLLISTAMNFQSEKLDAQVQRSGLKNIYSSEGQALDAMGSLIKKSEFQIRITGTIFSSYFWDYLNLKTGENRISPRVSIKILLQDPTSEHLQLIADFNRRSKDTLQRELLSEIKKWKYVQESQRFSRNIDVRMFSRYQGIKLAEIDTRVFFTPAINTNFIFPSPTFEFTDNSSEIYRAIKMHFDLAWESSIDINKEL